MMLRVAAGITGFNLCALGDSIEPFLKSVCCVPTIQGTLDEEKYGHDPVILSVANV